MCFENKPPYHEHEQDVSKLRSKKTLHSLTKKGLQPMNVVWDNFDLRLLRNRQTNTEKCQRGFLAKTHLILEPCLLEGFVWLSTMNTQNKNYEMKSIFFNGMWKIKKSNVNDICVSRQIVTTYLLHYQPSLGFRMIWPTLPKTSCAQQNIARDIYFKPSWELRSGLRKLSKFI